MSFTTTPPNLALSLNPSLLPINRYEGNVTLKTSLGNFTIELYWKHAPKTCRNFFELARSGYYNDTVVHRISPGFVIQMGDPEGTGLGGESIYGKHMPDEFHPELRFTGAGIVAMANSGKPDTNGSQFFITLSPTPFLDGKNTIFGRVSRGMGVVAKIGALSVSRDEKPKDTTVKIHKCAVELLDDEPAGPGRDVLAAR